MMHIHNQTILLAISLLFPSTAIAQQSTQVIIADLAIDGYGRMINDPVIVIHDSIITTVSSGGEYQANASVIDLRGYTILPGLIDCHVHIAAVAGCSTNPARCALHAARNAYSLLMSGFTTVRSLGNLTDVVIALREALAEGVVPGPRLLVAGNFIRDGNAPGVDGNRVREGAEPANETKLRTMVQERASAGVDWIKVMATGSSTTGGEPHYSEEQLRWIVDEANKHNLPVAAHAHSSEGVRRALAAGVRTIEHGVHLDHAMIDVLAETQSYLCPNLYLPQWYLSYADEYGWDEDGIRRLEDTIRTRNEMFRRAVIAGVPIIHGTDAIIDFVSSGTTGAEFESRHAAGQSTAEAIVSATTRAAEALMLTDRGDIRTGLLADIIAVEGNPLENVSALRKVSFVMKGGQVLTKP